MRINLEPISVSQLARACVANGASILGEHPVEVEASDLVALAYRTAMNRILENLLRNAAKYSAADAPLTIGFAATADRVRVTVTDHGRGVAPDDLDTVFGEFNRARLAENDGGTGLAWPASAILPFCRAAARGSTANSKSERR